VEYLPPYSRATRCRAPRGFVCMEPCCRGAIGDDLTRASCYTREIGRPHVVCRDVRRFAFLHAHETSFYSASRGTRSSGFGPYSCFQALVLRIGFTALALRLSCLHEVCRKPHMGLSSDGSVQAPGGYSGRLSRRKSRTLPPIIIPTVVSVIPVPRDAELREVSCAWSDVVVGP